jgi:hypothetical protein
MYQTFRDPRQGNQPGDYSQMSPYRDLEQDEERQRQTIAAAIAPQPADISKQGATGAAPPDYSQQQRAQLQGSSRNAPGRPQSGSLASLSQGGLQAPQQGPLASTPSYAQRTGQPGSLADLTGGNTGVTGGRPAAQLETAGGMQMSQGDPAVLAAIRDEMARGVNVGDQPAPAARPQGDPSWFTQGWDQGKIDSGHKSPKYDVFHALKNAGFDPRQGITPEVEAVLDGLGYGDGTVTGSDTYRFNSDDPSFNGITEFDLIRGFDTGNGQWNFEPVQGGPQGGDPALMAAIAPQGFANPQEQELAASLGLDTNNPLWRQILEQLVSGAGGGDQPLY